MANAKIQTVRFGVAHGFELMGRLVSQHDSKRDLISEAMIESMDAVNQ